MPNSKTWIPTSHPVFTSLENLAKSSRIVVFVGLPGTGKSLYINQFHQIALQQNRKVEIIQWDVVRKSFETEKISTLYPTIQGQTHAGIRLIASNWLLAYLKKWHGQNVKDNRALLMIEAPLVGGRFSNLVHIQDDTALEKVLSQTSTQFILPIPSNKVRLKIVEERKAQIKEDATKWSGAKPSVLKQLWLDTLHIGNEIGLVNEKTEAYEEMSYATIYGHILRHRNLNKWIIKDKFDIQIENESLLHGLKNSTPSKEEIEKTLFKTQQMYPDNKQINAAVLHWYDT